MIAPLVGVVVIGRNEGERLVRCLQSVVGDNRFVVYVDSGSSDGSVDRARKLGACVTSLEISQPFTAARARNAGLRELVRHKPDAQYVQFVDGDCEVVPTWIPAAMAFLEKQQDVAVVCGRRRERQPDASIYNELCDMEWDTPVGEARACGGDALMCVASVRAVGGYRDELIAGEEPELCVRLRAAGWKVWRLEAEMTLHDAAIARFSQWWRRTMRGGYAFAEGAHLHGSPPERHWVRETRSCVAWAAIIPALAGVATFVWWPWGILVILVYPLQVVRLAIRGGQPFRKRFLRAWFLTIGKFAEFAGFLKFHSARGTGRRGAIIEYK